MHLLTSIDEAVPAVASSSAPPRGVVTPLDSAPAVVAVEVRVSVGVPSAPAVPAATTAAAAVSGRSADAPALPPATEITGRIGLVRAEDSTGCVVAIDGHWFDVADILAGPTSDSSSCTGFRPPGPRSGTTWTRAPCSSSAWTSRASVSGHERAPRHDRDGRHAHRRGHAPGSVPLWLAVPLTIPRRRSRSGGFAHGEHRSPGGVGVLACPHNSQRFLVGGASLAGAGRVQARAAARRSEAESLDAARAG